MNFKVYRISIIVALVFLSSFLCYNIFQHLNSSLLNQQDAAAAVPMDAAVILESDNIQKVWSAVSESASAAAADFSDASFFAHVACCATTLWWQ